MGRIWTNGTGLALNATNLNSLESDLGRAVKPWAANTNYGAGQAVVSPSGDVVTANATHTSGSSFTAANWTRNAVNKGDLVYNVKDYGAKGDGTTDDTAAFQSAVNAANTAGGGVVYAPKGRYALSASITWRSNVRLIGQGMGNTILAPLATITAAPIQVGGSSSSPLTNVVFADFEIDGSAVPTTTSSKGIFITYMKRARFKGVYIHDTTATGFGCDFLQDVVFEDCIAENCGRAAVGAETTTAGCSGFGVGTGVYQTEAVMIRNCTARNNARYGIFFEYQSGIGTYLSRGVIIEGNHVEGNWRGIGSCGVERAKIRGNSVTGSASYGIHVGVSDSTHGALSIGDQILGNTVTLGSSYGINIDASTGSMGSYVGAYLIEGNTVRENSSVGIKVTTSSTLTGMLVDGNVVKLNGNIGIDIAGGGCLDSSVSNNLVQDNTGDGMRILAPSTRVKFSGNKVSDTRTSGSKTQTYGLDIVSTVTDCDIRGNDLRGNATAAISRGGTVASATVIRDNLGDGPAAVDSLTVAASPMAYTAGAGQETLYVIGGTWTSIQIGGATVLTGPGTIELEPYDSVTFTYTGAPTAIKRRRKSGA